MSSITERYVRKLLELKRDGDGFRARNQVAVVKLFSGLRGETTGDHAHFIEIWESVCDLADRTQSNLDHANPPQ